MFQEFKINKPDQVNNEYVGSLCCHFNISTESDIFNSYLKDEIDVKPKDREAVKEILKEIGSLRGKGENFKFNLITDIYIEEDHRDQGLGSDLMDEVMGSSSSAFILLADIDESAFSVDWYEKYGFKKYDEFSDLIGLPLMIKF